MNEFVLCEAVILFLNSLDAPEYLFGRESLSIHTQQGLDKGVRVGVRPRWNCFAVFTARRDTDLD